MISLSAVGHAQIAGDLAPEQKVTTEAFNTVDTVKDQGAAGPSKEAASPATEASVVPAAPSTPAAPAAAPKTLTPENSKADQATSAPAEAAKPKTNASEKLDKSDKSDRSAQSDKSAPKKIKRKRITLPQTTLTTKDGKLSDGKEPAAAAETEGGRKGFSVELGKNPIKNTPVVKRYDDDETQLAPTDPNNKGRFYQGSRVEDSLAREQSIRYVYVSRGAWLIRLWQPYLDRLGLEVIKTDNSDLYAGYMEASRTFSYICLLIASDDGTDKMLKTIGKAVSLHREAISNLRLQWSKKNESVTSLFEDYVQATFFKNLDEKTLRIPAGSLSNSQYKTLQETYRAEDDESSAPLQFFDKKDLKTKK